MKKLSREEMKNVIGGVDETISSPSDGGADPCGCSTNSDCPVGKTCSSILQLPCGPKGTATNMCA